MIVAKVGGSLFDWPGLKPALRAWLATHSGHVLLVAGGGLSAEAVRVYDRVHMLGEEVSHQLAIKSLAVTTGLLQSIVAGLAHVTICDVVTFCERDEILPHAWAVSSDSIAARIAEVKHASSLILLKSTAWPNGQSWADLARAGFVDDHFPLIATRLKCPIRCVNLRDSDSANS